jgi:hypothetical protein
VKVAEMEAKQYRLKDKAVRDVLKCKLCGRQLASRKAASLCQACREFESMLDDGKPRVCPNGHIAEMGKRCMQCRHDAEKRYAERLRKKRDKAKQ